MASLRKPFILLAVCLSAPLLASDPAYLVKKINQTPMGFSSYPNGFTAASNTAVFYTTNGITTPLDEWRTDGTEAGTVKIGSAASGAVSWNGRAWMVMPNNGVPWRDFWSIGDAQTAATHEFTFTQDIDASLMASSDRLYFFSGTTLWRTDGTLANTSQVSSAFVDPWQQQTDKWWVSSGQTLYFIGYDRNNGNYNTCLFKVDNTGLSVVANFGYTADKFRRVTVAGSYVYFVRSNGSTLITQLWRSNGTAAGTSVVTTAQGGNITIPDSTAIVAAGSSIYFTGDDGGGSKLWRSDGTDDTTTILATSLPGASTTFTGTLLGFAAGGSLVFF